MPSQYTKQFGSRVLRTTRYYIRYRRITFSTSFSPHMEEIKKNAETFFEEIRRIGDKANWDIPLRTELIACSHP